MAPRRNRAVARIGLWAYSKARGCLVSLHAAHVLPVWMSTFSGTLNPAGTASIASFAICRVSSTSGIDRRLPCHSLVSPGLPGYTDYCRPKSSSLSVAIPRQLGRSGRWPRISLQEPPINRKTLRPLAVG